MPKLTAYHRPKSVDEALQLLQRPGTVALAGGTQLIANWDETNAEAVDLQALGLEGIDVAEDLITLKSMTRLQAIVADMRLPKTVRQLAQREGPNTFRNISTIGGTVATADWESELYAALLVHAATVTVQSKAGVHIVPLPAFSASQGELITAVTIQRAGRTAVERVARTPADKPIVAVVGRKDESDNILLALCGVANRPLLVAPDAIDQLDPPTDFRGTSAYRRHAASVLTNRVMQQLV